MVAAGATALIEMLSQGSVDRRARTRLRSCIASLINTLLSFLDQEIRFLQEKTYCYIEIQSHGSHSSRLETTQKSHLVFKIGL